MDDELKQRVLAYADRHYAAARHKSIQETTFKVAQAKSALASRGLIASGAMVQEIARLEGEHINALVKAKTDALLNGYELYGAEIDEFILQEATKLRESLIKSISSEPYLLPPSAPAGDTFLRLLITNTDGVIDTVACEIEQRRVIPKLRKPQAAVQNIYHLHGNNARVNIESTDQSLNVVNLTSQEVLLQLRQVLTQNTTGEIQEQILQKLDALEEAQNSPSFAQRYTEFIAATADYVTLLTPFIPALAEMLHNALAR